MSLINNIRTVSIPSLGKIPLAANPGSFTPSGTKREHKAGRLAEDGGRTESEVPATLSLNINVLGGIDVAALNSVVDEDITIRLADGQVHMMSQAYVIEPVALESGESKITIMSNISERIS